MRDMLILLNQRDCVTLERLTYNLLNNINNIRQYPKDEELRLEVTSILQSIFDILRKYWSDIPRRVRISDGAVECLIIASFLYRVAHSSEWDAPDIKKRCVDILTYAV